MPRSQAQSSHSEPAGAGAGGSLGAPAEAGRLPGDPSDLPTSILDDVLPRHAWGALASELPARDDLEHRAVRLLTFGAYAEAERLCDEALARNLADAEAWRYKGRALAGLGEPRAALHCFARALAVEPADASIWADRAESFAALGRLRAAERCLRRALRLDPESVEVRARLGDCHRTAGRLVEALDDYSEALKREPANRRALFGRGDALLALGRPAEARRAFCEAGQTLLSAGDPEWALDAYDAALAIDRTDRDAWSGWVRTLEVLGQPVFDSSPRGGAHRALADHPRHLAALHAEYPGLPR